MLMRRFLAALLLLALPLAAHAQLAYSPITNDGTTGTTVGHLAKIIDASGTPTAIKLGTSDTIWAGLVVAETGASATTGNAIIAIHGPATCAYDGATTDGDYVTISSTTAGDCHDTGAATYPTSGAVVGIVTQTLGSAGNASTYLIPPGGIAPTGVTAGSYTSSNITVGADGRLTAAANGSGGGASLGPGTIAGNWYQLYSPQVGQSVAGGAVNTTVVSCSGGTALNTYTISSLGMAINTAGTTNIQLAIYANGAWGRPAAPLNHTGNIVDTSTGSVNGALGANVQLTAGTFYWTCYETGDNTVQARAFNTNGSGGPMFLGSATQSHVQQNTVLTGVQYSGNTFGTWPTFTSGTTWTDDTAPSTPVIQMLVASVP